ncbi:hypothetical protein SDC9_110637 [bioreactor metagenome]|uniref:Uncharacterized protein n=1 Tax=bioreactor metagenome TaxID=1076179 RepID=A0A645BPN2_9ZZZZ
MVEVVEDTVGMGCIYIEIGIVRCCFVISCIPPHLGKWIGARSVVVDYVEDHRHAPLVARIDELLVHPVGTVCLVHGEEEGGVIAPTIVSVELLYWHQLNGIYAQRLQIIQLRHRPAEITALCEIAQQQFIDYQIVAQRFFEVCHLPVVILFLNPEYRNHSDGSFRVHFVLRIGAGGYVLVVGRVEYLAGVGVGHTDGVPACVTQVVLEGILFRRLEAGEGDPPAAGVIIANHLRFVVIAQRPVVEVSYHIGEILPCTVLVLIIQHQCHRAIVYNVDTLCCSGRQGACFDCSRLERLILVVGNGNKKIVFNSFFCAIRASYNNAEFCNRRFS